jgi:hypothetical protein
LSGRARSSAAVALGVWAGGCGGSTTTLGPAGHAHADARNGAIAYGRTAGIRDDDASRQIFVHASDGSVRQLTRYAGGAGRPAWSPGGSRRRQRRRAPCNARVHRQAFSWRQAVSPERREAAQSACR